MALQARGRVKIRLPQRVNGVRWLDWSIRDPRSLLEFVLEAADQSGAPDPYRFAVGWMERGGGLRSRRFGAPEDRFDWRAEDGVGLTETLERHRHEPLGGDLKPSDPRTQPDPKNGR